jgi:hypothetical protein
MRQPTSVLVRSDFSPGDNMAPCLKRRLFICWSIAAIIWLITPVHGQETDRGVTILDAAPAPPPLPKLTPAAPISPPFQTNTEPGAAENPDGPIMPPTTLAPAPLGAVIPPELPTEHAPSAMTEAGRSNIDPYEDQAALSEALGKLPNAAGMSVKLLPSSDVQVGTRLSIHVLSRKSGYLILIDVDSSGKLTQIFPNPRSLLASKSSPQRANLIEAGKPVVIPDNKNPFSGFEFRATPPAGRALLVALLSNRAVQVLDLPDVPSSMVGRAAALTYLEDMAQRLKVAQLDGALGEILWSIDAKFYSIR